MLEDYFYLNEVYPDINFIRSSYKSFDEMKNSCTFVLDANVLLSPYSVSPKSFEDICKIFKILKKNNRIVVPFRAIQEYAKNRGNRIKDIFKKFDEALNNSNSYSYCFGLVPLLESDENYQSMLDVGKQINTLKEKYRESLKATEHNLKKLYWNDPVGAFYKEFLTDEIIINFIGNKDEIIKDLEFRIKHEIAPAFKDADKSDRGIGDLIIWYTIIQVGKNNDVVFVSNDRKEDWYYCVQKGTPICPKFELYNEFRIKTGGKSLNIINFEEFLGSQNAKEDTIAEVQAQVKKSTVYDIIEPEKFIEELINSLTYFEKINGFLSSKFFIETYLANKGYDISNSWDIFNRFRDQAVIIEYQHIDPKGIHPPVSAVKLAK